MMPTNVVLLEEPSPRFLPLQKNAPGLKSSMKKGFCKISGLSFASGNDENEGADCMPRMLPRGLPKVSS